MLPNEDQQAIAAMARQFARERLKPFAEAWDREHRYPAEAIAEMAGLDSVRIIGVVRPAQGKARIDVRSARDGSCTGSLPAAMMAWLKRTTCSLPVVCWPVPSVRSTTTWCGSRNFA